MKEADIMAEIFTPESIKSDLITELKNTIRTHLIDTQTYEDTIEIDTPFLDRYFDEIAVFVTYKNSVYTVTDDGYTLSEMLSVGTLSKYQRDLIHDFGCSIIRDEELTITARTAEELAENILRLVQLMIILSFSI